MPLITFQLEMRHRHICSGYVPGVGSVPHYTEWSDWKPFELIKSYIWDNHEVQVRVKSDAE